MSIRDFQKVFQIWLTINFWIAVHDNLGLWVIHTKICINYTSSSFLHLFTLSFNFNFTFLFATSIQISKVNLHSNQFQKQCISEWSQVEGHSTKLIISCYINSCPLFHHIFLKPTLQDIYTYQMHLQSLESLSIEKLVLSVSLKPFRSSHTSVLILCFVLILLFTNSSINYLHKQINTLSDVVF